MLKAVIFDMDGVLVDSEPLHFKSNQMTLRKYCGLELEYDYYKQYIGSTVTFMWKKIVRDFGIVDYSPETLQSLNDEILDELVQTEGYPPVKGAAELVRSLHRQGYLLAVASSSSRRKIEENLKHLDIRSCFSAIVSGVELERPKPNPDIFQKAVEELGVQTEECLVIEDSMNGVKASVAAGIPCVGYINPNSGEQDLSEADYLVEDFSSVEESFLRMVHDHHFGEP